MNQILNVTSSLPFIRSARSTSSSTLYMMKFSFIPVILPLDFFYGGKRCGLCSSAFPIAPISAMNYTLNMTPYSLPSIRFARLISSNRILQDASLDILRRKAVRMVLDPIYYRTKMQDTEDGQYLLGRTAQTHNTYT
jgi:hypothetical protein